MPYGFVIDQNRCIGCHACTVACKSENDVPVGSFRTWVKYTESGSFPDTKRDFTVLRCNHCTNAPCVTICPVNALDKRDDGIVDLDRDVCIGCKACMQACPYDALYLNEDDGCAEKCHYCAHRVDVGLEPACVTVCPEQAIIAGDFSDENSKIGQAKRQPDAIARRTEQGTGPNVWYLGADPIALDPGRATEPDQYLWSERRLPPPDYPPDMPDIVPDTRTVLDVNHDVHWGWKVASYLVTKGISAGAILLAPLVAAVAPGNAIADWAPEAVGLFFLTVTLVLLVVDLKRPAKFLSIMLRPNTKSWLVKGAWVLTAFGGVAFGALALRYVSPDVADVLRWLGIPLAVMAAGYTAFLFAQCEGRDLWQHKGRLFWHLIAQAIMLGSAGLLPLLPIPELGLTLGLGALLFGLLALWEAFGSQPTTNGRLAASLLPRIPAWNGTELGAFHLGLGATTAGGLFGVLFALTDVLTVGTASIACALVVVGTFFYERAYLRAGQLPPLS